MHDVTTASGTSSDNSIMLGVLRALAQEPGLTRGELVARVNASRPSVSAALRALEARGFLEQRVHQAGNRAMGRPPMRVFLAGSAASCIGLEITRTELHAGMFDVSGGLLAEKRIPIDEREDTERLLDGAETLVRELVVQSAGATEYILGIGVAIAAPIDERGNVVEDVSLEQWSRVDLADELGARIGLPVGVENDANAATLAEHRFGAGRECGDLLYLHLSPGVGAGLILDNRLYRGASGVAGEIGHVTVDPAGRLCSCGGRGCLETVASPVALEGELRSVSPEIELDSWERLVAAGDRHALRLAAEAGIAIGSAVASAVNLLNPERVVVGGQLADAGAELLAGVEEGIARHAIAPAASRAIVVRGELGDHAAILGAAAAQISRKLEVLVSHPDAA